jgi:anti-sigma factor RsiW
MTCDHCKNRLSAYIDSELPVDERLELQDHLMICPSCRAEYDTLRQIGVLFGRLPEETPSPGFVQATVSKAASLPRPARWSERFLDPVLSFMRSAAVFVFAPEGFGANNRKNLSSRGYLRAFDDSPPGSFADVYLTVIQGGSH